MGVNLSNYGNALHNCRITSNSRVSSKGALVWVLGPLGQELKWHLPNPMFLALLCDWFWGSFIHKKYESLQIEDSLQLKITSTWRSCIQWYTFVGVGPLGQEHKWYLPNPMFWGFALCLICFLDWFWGPFIHTKKMKASKLNIPSNYRLHPLEEVASNGTLLWVLGPLGQDLKGYLPNKSSSALLYDWFVCSIDFEVLSFTKRNESLQIEGSIQLEITSNGTLLWVLGPLGQDLKWYPPNQSSLALLYDWFYFLHPTLGAKMV